MSICTDIASMDRPGNIVPPRLWLVEDDIAFARSISLGCKAIQADCLALDGLDALKQAFSLGKPGILVLDLNLGRHDSIQVMEFLVAMRCTAPIVLMSGSDSRVLRFSEQIGRDLGLNIIGSLTKPFGARDMFDLINQRLKDNTGINARELADALNHDQIIPYFQPIISLQNEKPVGAEALARWLHPQRGMIAPLDFIPLAEQTGLMEPMTSHLLDAIARQAALLDQQGRDVTLSVNISAISLQNPDFADRLLDMLARRNIPPHRIKIEITESIAVGAGDQIIRLLTRLRINGFSISIDDFGTGYSSLTALYRLPFSELKIDKSFVLPMLENPDALAIVRTLIDLAHNLGLTAIAEGVETAALRDRLIDLGCDYAQGYFYARPLAANDFMSWLGDPGNRASA